jgi:hypothetical protein
MLAIGIGLLRRRPWSVRVGVVWAVVDIALTIVCSAYSTWEQIGVLGNQLGGMIVPSGITWAGGGCLFGCSVLVGCAFPAFFLIWFSRRTIKDEVATWVQAAS